MYIRSSSFPAVMIVMLFVYAGFVAVFKESKNEKGRKKFGSMMNDDLSRKFAKLNTLKPSVPSQDNSSYFDEDEIDENTDEGFKYAADAQRYYVSKTKKNKFKNPDPMSFISKLQVRKSEYDLVDEDRAKHGKLSQESRDDEKNWF